jgi:2'-5' RNA ligase
VASTSSLAATSTELRDHWVWRPEWTPERTCLYWYLTFGEGQVAAALGDDLLRAVRRAEWLDAVPHRWCHVTVADIGFADELSRADVDRVTAAVARAVSGEDRLRAIKARVRRTTSAVLGARHTDVHRRLFWPHVSLGYVNRRVDADTATRFVSALPAAAARLDVDTLTLAAVTRRDHRYQWQVQARVDLAGDVARAPW